MRIVKDADLVVTLFGALVSILLGVLFYIRSETATALAVVAGLEGIVLTLQLQALVAKKKSEEIQTAQDRMLVTIETIPWLKHWLIEISNSLINIKQKYDGTPAETEARRLFDDISHRLQGLERGQLEIEFEDIALVLERTENVKRTLTATSVQSIDLSWWSTPHGERYWACHLAALRRGVTITRIFIYDEWSEDLNTLAERQAKAGVRVFRATRLSVHPVELRRDIILWDDECAYETRLVGDGSVATNFFMVDPLEIKLLHAKVGRVLQSATEFP